MCLRTAQAGFFITDPPSGRGDKWSGMARLDSKPEYLQPTAAADKGGGRPGRLRLTALRRGRDRNSAATIWSEPADGTPPAQFATVVTRRSRRRTDPLRRNTI